MFGYIYVSLFHIDYFLFSFKLENHFKHRPLVDFLAASCQYFSPYHSYQTCHLPVSLYILMPARHSGHPPSFEGGWHLSENAKRGGIGHFYF